MPHSMDISRCPFGAVFDDGDNTTIITSVSDTGARHLYHSVTQFLFEV